jgi:hypothetical protein
MADFGQARKYGRLVFRFTVCALACPALLHAPGLLSFASGINRTAEETEAALPGVAQAAAVQAPESILAATTISVRGLAADAPTVRLRRGKLIRLPGAGEPGDPHAGDSDSNSPAHWDGSTFYLLNSAVASWRSSGPDLFHLNAAKRAVVFDRTISGGRWIESTWKAEDGTLYGWYHNEPSGSASKTSSQASRSHLTAPRIGAARLSDNGATWKDLGIVLEAPPGARQDTRNEYFAGGNGDFTVIADQRREYLYFLFSTYHRELAEQGVSIARMRYADRNRPAGRIWKWRAGRWAEPGVGGRVTPVFPAARDWHGDSPDAFWGASIHWNTHLQQYVALLNHAVDSGWKQEGIYFSFTRDLSDPNGWTQPQKLLDRQQIVSDPVTPNGWYPQVIGVDRARQETDKLAGRAARLFIHGRSRWELEFVRQDEVAEPVSRASN